ncbi:hypothetical protein V6Z11_A02G191800 [Gossypium hirsutum]
MHNMPKYTGINIANLPKSKSPHCVMNLNENAIKTVSQFEEQSMQMQRIERAKFPLHTKWRISGSYFGSMRGPPLLADDTVSSISYLEPLFFFPFSFPKCSRSFTLICSPQNQNVEFIFAAIEPPFYLVADDA